MAFQVDTGGTLETNLEAYWKLDDAANGIRLDAFGSHDLSDNNTNVGQGSGIVGNAADFPGGSSQGLTESDTTGLSISGAQDFTIAGWVNFDILAAGTHILAYKGTSSLFAGGFEYVLHYVPPGVNKFRFEVYDGTSINSVDATTFGAASTGTWIFVVAWHDSSSDVIGLQINNGTQDTISHTTGLQDGTGTFILGNTNVFNTSLNGRLDELGFWRKVLSTQERTDLYNGGSGNTIVTSTEVTETIDAQTDIDGTAEQEINSATTILSGQPEQTINADTTVLVSHVTPAINAETDIEGEVTQTIESATTILSLVGTETIDADSDILAVQPEQTIEAQTNIDGTVEQTINSNTEIKVVNITEVIGSNTTIMIQPAQTINANTDILVREADLKLFKESDLVNEIGVPSNTLDFGSVEAGTEFTHPDNPFVLFNDKGGILDSVSVRNVTMTVLQLDLEDELVGVSGGTPSEFFTVAFPPIVDDDDLIIVKINDIPWIRVSSFAGELATAEVYTLDASTGIVTFGDGIQGKIPPIGNTVKVTYTPDSISQGKELVEGFWFGVQSTDVISNNISVFLEERTPTDIDHVTVLNAPKVVSVSGVFLKTDPNRLGTNFFTGGSFDDQSGVITLGSSLPNTNNVLIDYVYTIEDDAEANFTQIGKGISHEFANPIPSNNGKKMNFKLLVPPSASPSGLASVRFKLNITYKE